MRPRKITIKTPYSPTEEVRPLDECVANLKKIGLDDQEISRLGKTLDTIFDYQLDKIYNKYEETNIKNLIKQTG
jgi:hypothetical protein